jgi:hypothetical protein
MDDTLNTQKGGQMCHTYNTQPYVILGISHTLFNSLMHTSGKFTCVCITGIGIHMLAFWPDDAYLVAYDSQN